MAGGVAAQRRWVPWVAVGLALVLVVAAYVVFLPYLARPLGQGGPPVGPVSNGTVVNYTSSVDGFALSYNEWLPAGYDPAQGYPLAIYLHGLEATTGIPRSGGYPDGLSVDSAGPSVINAASKFGFLLIAPNTRTGSGFYVDSPFSGPQAQDVLDAIHSEEGRHTVTKLYLFGESMGSLGTFAIALHHPGMFSAIGVIAVASDLFETMDYHLSIRAHDQWAANAVQALLTTTGGSFPNQTAQAQQEAVYLSVARFDPGAFATLPLYEVAGGVDNHTPNSPAFWPYLNANDTLLTSTCLSATALGEPANCTVPLLNLSRDHPGEYIFRYVYSPLGGHALDLLNANDMFAFFAGQRGPGVYWSNFPAGVPYPAPTG